MEVGARWNQSPWIPTSGEMTEVSCRKGAHFLRVDYMIRVTNLLQKIENLLK
jgi:hypothetical protein